MCGDGAVNLAIKIKVAAGREALRVEFYRDGAFHQRQQSVAVIDDMGVGCVVGLGRDRGIRGHRIAQHPEQGFPGSAFQFVFSGAHPAILPAHAAVLEFKALDHPVAVEPVILVARARRVQWVRTIAKVNTL